MEWQVTGATALAINLELFALVALTWAVVAYVCVKAGKEINK